MLLAVFLLGCNQEEAPDGSSILAQTMLKHDSLGLWNEAKINLHIQEPRLSNPHRYSILELNNANGAFKLTRNRGTSISEHIIDSNGNSYVLLDGEAVIDTALIKQYRLDPSRNMGYKKFYKLLYGLPMSLNDPQNEIVGTSESVFDGEKCFKIAMKLNEPMISEYWNLFVSKASMEVKGVEIVIADNDGGERIYFDELIVVNGIKIPRIRHWHELNNDTYSGSDLIIKEVK